MDMAKNDFESRFFDLLQKNLNDLAERVEHGFKDVNKKIDANTKTTNATKARVDRLDGKVFNKKPSTLATLFGDKQIITAFAFALMVFLLILASVLHVKVPNL